MAYTYKRPTALLRSHGHPVDVVKANGYIYFSPDRDARSAYDHIPSIYSMTIQGIDFLAYVKEALDEHDQFRA